MYLAIISCVVIFVFWVFTKDGLITSIKTIDEYNADVKEKIRWIRYKEGFFESSRYTEKDLYTKIKVIRDFILINMFCDFLALVIICVGSVIISGFYNPTIDYNYSFNINSLKDNLVTEGEIRGGMFCASGYVDGEINYYYLRDYNTGEKIEHIKASETYIKYDNGKKPNITVYKEKSNYPEWFKKVFFAIETDELKHYVITVPEGTVINNGAYQINME